MNTKTMTMRQMSVLMNLHKTHCLVEYTCPAEISSTFYAGPSSPHCRHHIGKEASRDILLQCNTIQNYQQIHQ